MASAAAAAQPHISGSSLKPQDHVVVMAGAYHGHLTSLIPLSPYKFWGKGGQGKQDWVHVMPCPDPYRYAVMQRFRTHVNCMHWCINCTHVLGRGRGGKLGWGHVMTCPAPYQ